jgi:AcrR family transcriptional regulator
MSTRREHKVDGAARDRDETLNGFGREGVVDIQRSRILTAMVETVAEHGAANVTVAHVVERAGISRRTFYEIFSDRDDCLLAAFDDAIQRVAGGVVPAYQQPGKWRERIRAGLIEFLSFLDDDPGTGRLVVVETLGAGPRALERRGNILAQIIGAVDEGRSEAKGGSEPPPLTAEGIAGAVLAVIHGWMVERRAGRLIELTGPLMSMIVLPYLGPAAARRELARPVPRAPVRPRPVNGDPLRGLEMRLTYRTMCVLLAVAARPGSSNRAVGGGAGITDQGQISKLLARLQRLGLIENTGVGPARGEPNAWRLTDKGREVYGVIAEKTAAG